MSLSNTFENDLAKLIFWGTAIADLAENDTSSPLTSLYAALHTADPGEAGSQTTNECNYTGYARVAIARTAGGFAITNNVVTLVANCDFPTCTAGPQTATHFSIGTALSGAGKILGSGTITPNISILVSGFPRLQSATNVTWD